MEKNSKVEGRSYTSNSVKLLKHLDKLKKIQDNEPPSPVMAHISIINACNLTCSFCCFANRDLTDRLPLERVKKALDSFKKIGVTGIEFTGGGEPTLHPDFEEIVNYSHSLGFKLGLCTNGKNLGTKIKKEIVSKFTWVRLGLYGFYEDYTYNLSVFEGTETTVSAAYVWDEAIETSNNPNVTGEWTDSKKKILAKKFQKRENFLRMIDWVEENKIPTRIAFNAIKKIEEVEKDIETIRGVLSQYNLKYAFLSDFNFKGSRRNDHCYMHMVKPFLFTDGYIYACPSAELSIENNYNYVPESQFMVCDIEGIEEFYSKPPSLRHHACKYCKYAIQNELIDDILTPTTHNQFA
jgi:MoaA/NifB/PqqE/SkfB family radical SAM enzyme